VTSIDNEDFELLTAAVREAGALAMVHFKAGVKGWEKSPGNPVSEADLAVDRLLKARLADARPDYAWLSEESADDGRRLRALKVWMVDPIDGTSAFVKQQAEFTISAALVRDGQPILAAVFNPATDEFFDARAGQGARRNGQRLQLAPAPPHKRLSLLASKRTFVRNGWLNRLPECEFHHRNSVAYRMALVAAGRFDATLSLSEKSDWDLAAADLIVREAGGRATTAAGEALRYNAPQPRHTSLLAAAPGAFEPLLALLAGRQH
jgi:myo-inositol-1(or 4)-monophosphatase